MFILLLFYFNVFFSMLILRGGREREMERKREREGGRGVSKEMER